MKTIEDLKIAIASKKIMIERTEIRERELNEEWDKTLKDLRKYNQEYDALVEALKVFEELV